LWWFRIQMSLFMTLNYSHLLSILLRSSFFTEKDTLLQFLNIIVFYLSIMSCIDFKWRYYDVMVFRQV